MGLASAKGDYDNLACAPRGLHESKGVRHYDKTLLLGDHYFVYWGIIISLRTTRLATD
jgi:hypothetical protein